MIWGLCSPTFDAMKLRQRWGTPFVPGEAGEADSSLRSE